MNAVKRSCLWILWRVYNWRLLLTFRFTTARHGFNLIHTNSRGHVEAQFRDAAVVVASYEDVYVHSTSRLIRALHSRGFDVYLVWNGIMPAALRKDALGSCVQIIERRRLGFDWAGYKLVFLMMMSDDRYKNSGLFFCNDSFFFLESTASLLDGVMSLEGDVKGLAFNKELTPHVVGAFVYLSQRARTDPRVVNFWQDFRPSWDKRTTIFRGELAHFRAIGEADLRISTLLPSLLHGPEQPRTNLELSLLRRKAFLGALPRESLRDIGPSSRVPARRRRGDGAANRSTQRITSELSILATQMLGELTETTSILHELGPFLSAGWGVPLKLDLLKWPHLRWSSEVILRELQASVEVSQTDREWLRSYLSTKASWASHSGIERYFFYHGFTG